MNAKQKLPKVFVVASGNPHKLREFGRILGFSGVVLKSAADFPAIPEPQENAQTFEGNALIKARAYAAGTGQWTIADDSGLEVDVLVGAPGVLSARYAGRHGDDAANNARLLQELSAFADPVTAHFTCVIALVSPSGEEYTFRGECPGHIIREPAGHNGFGYDPLFVPDGQSMTFGQLGSDVKDVISHRARAAVLLKRKISELFTFQRQIQQEK